MGTPELNKALSKCLGEITPPTKDTINPFYKSKYADLASIIDAVKIPLKNNGLSVTQTTQYRESILILVTTLRHVSGEEISGEYPVIPLKLDPQGFGSALTYARRYALQSLLMIAAEEDDDGNAASNKKPEPKSPTPRITGQSAEPTRILRMVAFLNEKGIDQPHLLKWLNVKDIGEIKESDVNVVMAEIRKHNENTPFTEIFKIEG